MDGSTEAEDLRGAKVPQLIPARMLNEYAYCPRLCYLEWVQGEFRDSVDTVDGRYQHRRVDESRGTLPDDGDDVGVIHRTSVFLSGLKVGVITRIDILEGEGRKVTPVDYKRGRVPSLPEGAYEPERVQVCAQGLVLRENGYECEEGVIYYVSSKKRINIPFDEALIRRTVDLLTLLRSMVEKGEMPAPLEDSPKCPRCSLVGICLPDEVNLLRGTSRQVRRLYPSRDDSIPVYVVGHGCSIRKKGERLEISREGETIQSLPLRDVSQLSIYGSAYITSPVLRVLMQRGIPVCYFSQGGWFYGYSAGMPHKNVELRILQFEAASNINTSLGLARGFIRGKIRNCRTILRRNDKDVPRKILNQLMRLSEEVETVDRFDRLLGFEGLAAQLYFSRFNNLLKTENVFSFENRNKRPPKDPVNAVLSYLYGVLCKELFITMLAVGFDPYLGFLHRPKYGRPALALDMMEEFRPLIADSVTLSLFNNGELETGDFIISSLGVALKADAKKRVLRGYERRINTLITHPLFGYSVSYRRIFEVQARLFSRTLSGELDGYPPFCTR